VIDNEYNESTIRILKEFADNQGDLDAMVFLCKNGINPDVYKEKIHGIASDDMLDPDLRKDAAKKLYDLTKAISEHDVTMAKVPRFKA